jgi:hypothetical protein
VCVAFSRKPELTQTGSSWLELDLVEAGRAFIFISSATELGLAPPGSSSKELEPGGARFIENVSKIDRKTPKSGAASPSQPELAGASSAASSRLELDPLRVPARPFYIENTVYSLSSEKLIEKRLSPGAVCG